MYRVLLVEDDANLRASLSRGLRDEFELKLCANLDEARKYLIGQDCHLILLDLCLPDGDGLNFFAQLKSSVSTRRIPVMILTGRDDLPSKITAFSLGAEDYLVKPFDTRELIARAKAKIISFEDRYGSQKQKQIFLGNLEIQTEGYDVFLYDGVERKKVDLTLKEYRLLLLFAQEPQRVFTREDLLNKVWRNEYVLDRTVDTHVSRLRKKLSQSGIEIKPVPGVGYRLDSIQDMSESA